VLVIDSLPPGTAYLTSTGGLSSTYNVTDHQVVWDLGTVPPGASGTLTALTQPAEEALIGQVITNAAYLDFTSARGFSATVSATSTVLAPELTVRYPDGGIPPDPLLLCEGDQVTLAASTNHSGPLDYSWDLGDGTRASAPSVTHAWNYGTYTVRLTIINTLGWVETDTLGLQVGHVPVAGFTSNSPVELGQNAVFTDRTTYEPSSWLWDFGDGVGTSDQPNPIYNYSNQGVYNVTLTVTNRCGTDVYVDRFQVGENFIYLPLVVRDDL
jgi:hypothetical protein